MCKLWFFLLWKMSTRRHECRQELFYHMEALPDIHFVSLVPSKFNKEKEHWFMPSTVIINPRARPQFEYATIITDFLL